MSRMSVRIRDMYSIGEAVRDLCDIGNLVGGAFRVKSKTRKILERLLESERDVAVRQFAGSTFLTFQEIGHKVIPDLDGGKWHGAADGLLIIKKDKLLDYAWRVTHNVEDEHYQRWKKL